jgi:hypothetical protein
MTVHIFFCICGVPENTGENESVSQLFIDCKKVYDSVKMEVLFNDLMGLVSL